MLPCLVSVLLTFKIQGVLKFEKKKSVAKRLIIMTDIQKDQVKKLHGTPGRIPCENNINMKLKYHIRV